MIKPSPVGSPPTVSGPRGRARDARSLMYDKYTITLSQLQVSDTPTGLTTRGRGIPGADAPCRLC